MKICYTTICDVNYLAPALTLYASLKNVSAHTFRFYTLDEAAAGYLARLKLPGAQVFAPKDYIPGEVAALRNSRSAGAFAFTVKPFAIMHALETGLDYQWAGHLDVDIFAFSDPGVILSQLDDDKAVSLTPHRFSTEFKHYEPTAGRFNAGYAAFRNTVSGREILRHWCDLCLEWCHDYVDGARYGDQKYLELLADQYPAVDACRHPGANAAPWNIDAELIAMQGGTLYVAGNPLFFYHFQGFKLYGPRLCSLYAGLELIVTGRLKELVYKPYVNAVYAACRRLARETDWKPVYTRRAFRTKLRGLFNRLKGTPHNFFREPTGQGALPRGAA